MPTRRWGHYDRYTITKTDDGWYFGDSTHYSGNTDKEGNPYLYKILEHDSVAYPNYTPDVLKQLWERAESVDHSDEEVISDLKELAEWISDCEKAKRDFHGYL